MLLPRLIQYIALLLLISQLFLSIHAYAFTIGEERMIGEQLLYAVRSEFDILDDPDISEYINGLGGQALKIAGPQYFNYHFFVVKNNQFNAFAAPSGLIFFNTGLIKTMRNEDQLVSVLAHEVGHVTSRHISQRMSKQGKMTAATMLFGLASLAVGNAALTQGLLTGAMAANQTAGLNFSRHDEEQADRLAYDWMRAMGRNPEAMKDMLKVMRRVTRYRSEQLPPYLLTHPNPEDRLHYVRSLLELDREKNKLLIEKGTDNFAFLRFKYRVLSQSLEADELRAYCANLLASSRNREEQIMADYGLALLNAEDRKFSEAARQIESVHREYPNEDILNIDLAVIHLRSGRIDRAAELLLHAYQHDPTDMYAAFHLAEAREQQGDLAGAERLYLEVAVFMPDYSKLYYALGRLKSGQGEIGTSNFYLAKHYLYEGRIKDAKQYLKRAKKDQSVPKALQEEAETILKRLKELEDA